MPVQIEDLLNEYKCPLINAFFFPNGEMLVIENLMTEDYYSIRALCKSSIESYFKYNSESEVASFDFLGKYENDRFSISFGEGSFGSDGVIQLRDKMSNQLIWFLFLNNSNPFNKIEVYDNYIAARSTLGYVWKIPIFNPEKIVLENMSH